MKATQKNYLNFFVKNIISVWQGNSLLFKSFIIINLRHFSFFFFNSEGFSSFSIMQDPPATFKQGDDELNYRSDAVLTQFLASDGPNLLIILLLVLISFLQKMFISQQCCINITAKIKNKKGAFWSHQKQFIIYTKKICLLQPLRYLILATKSEDVLIFVSFTLSLKAMSAQNSFFMSLKNMTTDMLFLRKEIVFWLCSVVLIFSFMNDL